MEDAMRRFKVGDVVQFMSKWPWATHRVRITEVLPERHEYMAVELDYYYDWAECAEGPVRFWLGNVDAHVVTETEATR
jgi:hypothetical protein